MAVIYPLEAYQQIRLKSVNSSDSALLRVTSNNDSIHAFFGAEYGANRTRSDGFPEILGYLPERTATPSNRHYSDLFSFVATYLRAT